MAIKLIGAGFGRTGTTSLKAAVEKLGLAPCYHMFEVIKNPADADRWPGAAKGEPTNWQALLDGYQATLDWPGCSFYKALMATYPDAKVLLTTRDPESWYESAQATIYQSNQMEPAPAMHTFVEMVNTLLWQRDFHGRFEDKTYAISVFTDHIEEVKRTVPSEKLLVYNVKEGWEPLCRFLGVNAPEGEPFPHLNDKESFKQRVVGMIEQPG